MNNMIQEIYQAFIKSPEQIQHMWDNFPLGVLITDCQGLIQYYNSAHAKIDDLNSEDVLGKLEIEVLTPINGPNIMEVSQKTAQPILGYIFPYKTIKGKVINAAYWVFPIFKNNLVIGSICFTQPLLAELKNQSAAYTNPPIQWPGTVPINMPVKNIVGENKNFKKAIDLIYRNANNPFPILIAGETGSGKEICAKLTHKASKRRNKTYMAINCSAIPTSLLEGLLFGTTKGSFTGAIDRPGLFEEANGGTVYLDEIDSMPLDLQPKLLRVLQEMKVNRVGSSKDINLDLKVISSIGSSAEHALESGLLRQDLFYRLAVIVVNIPPLRERLDDIEGLAEFFICKYNNLLGKSALKLDNNLLRLMKKYHWPGNVRELEHLIAGALSMVSEENVITKDHIPEFYLQAFTKLVKLTDEEKFNLGTDSFKSPIQHFILEQQKIKAALKTTKGNITQAAKELNISRQLLNYRMLKHGISRYDFK